MNMDYSWHNREQVKNAYWISEVIWGTY